MITLVIIIVIAVIVLSVGMGAWQMQKKQKIAEAEKDSALTASNITMGFESTPMAMAAVPSLLLGLDKYTAEPVALDMSKVYLEITVTNVKLVSSVDGKLDADFKLDKKVIKIYPKKAASQIADVLKDQKIPSGSYKMLRFDVSKVAVWRDGDTVPVFTKDMTLTLVVKAAFTVDAGKVNQLDTRFNTDGLITAKANSGWKIKLHAKTMNVNGKRNDIPEDADSSKSLE
jgi:hypothetical protein